MKKVILSAIVAISLTGCTAADFERITKEVSATTQQKTNDFTNPPAYEDVVCKSNAAMLYAHCREQVQPKGEHVVSCVAEIIENKNGRKIKRTQGVSTRGMELYKESETRHIYHEEDEEGSSTITFNPKTGKGVYSVMDTNKVVKSGNVYSCF
ncbi:hypothetical protein ACN638_000104 [Escherichia coli]|uniref:hypothetical protein n=1 Tax=Escherichia coli TaxID=562 RepID=UPI00297872EB|nr:hypothetical protein [Escherichia coli]HEK8389298.1 hypothetical protein [Escherichia coli]